MKKKIKPNPNRVHFIVEKKSGDLCRGYPSRIWTKAMAITDWSWGMASAPKDDRKEFDKEFKIVTKSIL